MLRKSGYLSKNITIGLFIFFCIYLETAFLNNSTFYYTVFLSASVAAGFYISFGKDILPAIIFGTVFGTFVFELMISKSTLTDASLVIIPVLFLNVVSSLLLHLLLSKFTSTIPNTFRNGLLYGAAILITSSILSLLPAFQVSLSNDSQFLSEYVRFLEPLLVGFLVFTTPIILSNVYDDFFTFGVFLKPANIFFALISLLSTYIIFTNSITGVNFASSGSLLLLLFLISALMYNYRMLLFISLLYVTVYNVVYFKMLDVSELFTHEALNIYLLILVLVTIFIKLLVYKLRSSNIELEETKERYEDMVSSTLELLKVRETLSLESADYKETVMKDIFAIALRIFHRIDFALCVIKRPDTVEVIDAKGYDAELFNAMKLDASNFRWNHFEPVLLKDANTMYKNLLKERYPLFEKELPIIKESVSILIKLNDEEKGAIVFDIIKDNNNRFTEGDLYNIGAFQSMINSFYEMNELTIKNNNLRDDIVLSLIRTLELYDQYTGGHSEDVAFLANALCKELKIDQSTRYDIYWAGIVHDIGKIGIPSDIINKDGKLSLEEYKKVKEHPVFGYNILIKSEDLKPIAKLVRHHHEWYNGSGYPDGLKESEIPFGSQILQVADSVSAMATRRTYQKYRSFDEIIEELMMYSGVQFNPEIAEAMIRLINKGIVKDYFNSRIKRRNS